jgi:diguanylate cyclase (GGDEF)-like protein
MMRGEKERPLLERIKERLGRYIAPIENRLTVGRQIAWATAALCFGLVGVVTAGAVYLSRDQAAVLIADRMTQLARSTVNQLDFALFDISRDLDQFAHLNALMPVWEGTQEAQRELLEQLKASKPEFTWIGFVSPDGVIRAATGRYLEGQRVADRSWFRRAFAAPVIEDVYGSGQTAASEGQAATEPFRLVDMGFPIWTADGRMIGVLGVQLGWQWVVAVHNRILQRATRSGPLDLWLLSRDGRILLGGARGDRPFTDQMLATMRKNRHGAFLDSTDDERELTGYAVTTAYENSADIGWTVIARKSESEAYAPARQLAWLIAGLGILMTLIGMVFAGYIASRIARPIRTLTMDADRIGRDPSTTMLPRQSGSQEVVQLSSALRSLLRRIGFEQQRSQQAELRASENAAQFADDLRALRKLADTDPLTNLMNRRAFVATASDALAYFKRYERPLAMLVIDIDHFKAVNDRYGHAAGDAAIKYIGERIESAVRATDKVGRFGGEEFVVLLREVDELSARAFADRVRAAIEEAAVSYGSDTFKITVSIGVSVANAADRDISDTIERADRGLYMAKNTGRNRVFFMPTDTDAPNRHAA